LNEAEEHILPASKSISANFFFLPHHNHRKTSAEKASLQTYASYLKMVCPS